MFGYAAPMLPPRPGQPAQPGPPAPTPGYPPAGQPAQGFPPPQQQGFAPPQQQGFAPQGQPQQANPYGQPQGQPGYPPAQQAPQANPYGQPQGQPGYPPAPQANPYGQPQGQPGYPPAPQANPYGQPQGAPQANPYGQPHGAPQANPYGQPQAAPQANPYGQPQANPYGQPQGAPPANPYGQPHGAPQANPYGQPQANPYGAPGANPGYPQAQPGFGQPPAAAGGGAPLPGALGKLPGSPPGTIMGIPVSRLRDASLQRRMMFLAGVALVASVFVPVTLSPLNFTFSGDAAIIMGGSFGSFLFPLIAGGCYLLLTVAPQNMRDKVPPIVLQWLPFGVSYAGVMMLAGIMNMGFVFSALASGADGLASIHGVGSFYLLGYATLCFGLLSRIAKPEDQTARIVIAVGAVFMILTLLGMLGFIFSFGGGIIMIIYNLLWFAVVAAGALCICLVIPPQKLPPALRMVDALGPLIAALLLVWLVVSPILFFINNAIHEPKHILDFVLILAHSLLPVVAYFGILMMTAPAAYEEAMRMFNKNKAA